MRVGRASAAHSHTYTRRGVHASSSFFCTPLVSISGEMTFVVRLVNTAAMSVFIAVQPQRVYRTRSVALMRRAPSSPTTTRLPRRCITSPVHGCDDGVGDGERALCPKTVCSPRLVCAAGTVTPPHCQPTISRAKAGLSRDSAYFHSHQPAPTT